jgi:hypothetical protein
MEAAQEAFVAPAMEEGVRFEEDALARVVALSGCYPAYIQAYGKAAWNMTPRSPITLGDVGAVEALVEAKLDEEFFHMRFEKAPQAERRYMAAMAELGDRPYSAGEVARRLGRSASSMSVHRESLVRKGLICSPQHGEIDFTVPHFAPFMRRRYSLGASR